MYSSFLMICFMNDKPGIVNHNLCLYRMHFLTLMVYLSSLFIFRPWNRCSVESMKDRKLGNTFQLCLEFSASLLCCISFEELTSIALSILQSFGCLYRCYSDPNQIESQLECKLCKGDS